MIPDESVGPSAQDLRNRAIRLRDCAMRAEKLLNPLATLVDAEVDRATTQGVWSGTFATDSTRTLTHWQQELRATAEDLAESLAMWRAEADRLDDQADDLE